jgi:hypothetical protein
VTQADLITVGLSENADKCLEDLQEKGIFREKMDGYRFAVALAIAQGAIPPDIEKRKTLYNVGSLDPDQTLRRAIEALIPEQLENTTAYRLIERLAEWGIMELHLEDKDGGIDFIKLLDNAASKDA